MSSCRHHRRRRRSSSSSRRRRHNRCHHRRRCCHSRPHWLSDTKAVAYDNTTAAILNAELEDIVKPDSPYSRVDVCVAVCSSLNTELEREKVARVDAENKQKELQATDARQQQKVLDLESQIRALEAAKVSSVFAAFSPCQTIKTCVMLANVEVDEVAHY